ncbi:GGDEF domain-containing response regulator [Polycyclovorans algicola]|uniref:GGDEF domain-containing response regulator n=1 Tax=Polycyclovorans algicola TaxID=616992 RepID=UPI0005BA6F6A|nr:diguanylate cyclase [Polycyclovorans algicola]
MTPDTAAQIHAELAALNLAYQARLTDDLLALQAQVASLVEPGAHQIDVPYATLLPALHQLIGSAGTFGEASLSDGARQIEHLLRSRQRDDRPWTVDDRAALVESVHGLARLRAGRDPQAATVMPGVGNREVRRVDVLEDDPSILSILTSALRSFGYVVEGHSSVEALEASLSQRRPDAMIVDVHLGAGGNGLALLESLQDQRYPPIPTLVITTRDDFAHRLRAVRAGAVGFFSKPVDLPQLENRLELCFDDYRGEPFRVVAVDDDPMLLARYQLVLGRAGVGVYPVSDPEQLHETLNSVVPDLLLLDVQMPGCTGAELAQMVRFDERWIGLPIIYVSAESDLGLQTAAMVRGGDEFMIKPINDAILVATVLSRSRRSRALANALARDSLTGLLKHGSAKEQLAQALSRATRSGQPCAVAMIDLDHFKRINDTHGHAVGDKVIRSLASLLKNSLRKDDIVGRYGGEEFLVVMNNIDAAAAADKLDRLREQFSVLDFQGVDGLFRVSFSGGVSDSRRFPDVADVLVKADAALYRAKAAGRDRMAVDAGEEAG